MSENERLARRLSEIASALNPKANAPVARVARTVSPEQVTAAFAFLQNSEGGQAVCVIFHAVLDTLINHKEGFDLHAKKLTELKGELAKKTEYHRIWDAGTAYKLNDEVTDKGQLWQCDVPISTARPGTSDDWKLKQKRETL
jgi:hypothetical protein